MFVVTRPRAASLAMPLAPDLVRARFAAGEERTLKLVWHLQVLEPGTVGVHAQHEKPVISGEIPRGYRYGATLRRDRRYDGRVWLEKSG
jgi:hypothetical protein